MSELEQRLHYLIAEACQHSPGSPERQKNLTQIIRLVSGKLWRENTPYYADALQQTWLYFSQNICEAGTAERYDPSRGSVVTWLNAHLRYRLQDGYISIHKQRSTRVFSYVQDSQSHDSGKAIEPIDQLVSPPDIYPILNILEDVKAWAEADATGELRNIHIKGHPHVNCQVLILRRLPPETTWKTLSEQFGLRISTLSSFYQRHCFPRLRHFGVSQGYITSDSNCAFGVNENDNLLQLQ